MKDSERDQMRQIILALIKRGPIHWTPLKKKVLGACYAFATDATFASQMKYLLKNRFIERVERGVYRITPLGEQFLQVLQYRNMNRKTESLP